ncbi:MAG: DNA/RNA non-specific endonuclease [Rhodobacteraceae bacterium]|nr:DNA/RNA non-specific endonuclease [Paracoccaceae bacterium]
MAETAQEKFLREKQEYEDALVAYRNILGRAAGTVQIPYAMQSSYAAENQGYERAATDPWITERFPDLQTAAERVQAEEQQFLAIDDPFPSHANSQCSIASYTAQKVYEYYALFETVYLLATDAAFRAQVVAQIEAFLTGSGITHYMIADRLQDKADQLMQARPDWLDFLLSSDEMDAVLRTRQADIDRDLEEIGRQTAFHMSIVDGKIAEFFKAVWQDLKQKYYDCGILYAVSTVGVDGIFLAAEIYSGLAFLRFLKFALRALPKTGQIVVDILDGNGRKIGSRTHSQAALEAKYGKPRENGVGGYAPDTNRDIPDTPAEEMLEQQRRDRENGAVRPGQQAAPEDVGPDPKVTALGNGQTRHQRGTNEQVISYDPETARPTGSVGTIRQDFGSTKRGDNATAVGKLGDKGDQGGHLAAHRFFGDTPDKGIAPQAGNLNMGAWKTMENEWADWTRMGYEVDFKVDPYPPGAVRPDEFDVQYVVRDPATGRKVYVGKKDFENAPGQKFSRVSWRDMQENYARK